jgi:hypothetical protein
VGEFGVVDRLPCHKIFEALTKSRVQVKIGSEQYGIDTGVCEFPLGLEGATRFDAAKSEFVLEINEPTYDEVEAAVPGRGRFTLTHEFAHLWLHPELLREQGSSPLFSLVDRQVRTAPTYCDPEWQANAFAAAALMPARGLAELAADGRLVAAEVQEIYRVSERAAEIRIGLFQERAGQLL